MASLRTDGGPGPQRTARNPTLTTPLLLVLAACSGFPPFAIDAYLPGFPEIAADLDATAAQVQLTLAAFLLATAIGQLIWGGLSDQIGRRPVLLVGIGVGVVSSLACALTDSIWLLIAMRALQGLGTGAVMVVARAVVADLSTGVGAARAFSSLAAVQSIAPILAPVMGGILIGPFGWRAAFWMLFVMTVCMSLAIAIRVPETVTSRGRRGGAGPLRRLVTDARWVLRDGGYVGAMITLVAGFASTFAYISASPFVMQNLMGFSVAGYSTVFVGTSACMVATVLVNRRLVLRVAPSRMIRVGVAGQVSGVVTLAVAVLALDLPVAMMILGFVLVQASQAMITSNCHAIALARVAPRTGTGSALMGGAQFAMAAVVAPLVGIAGEHTAVPMVSLMSVTVVVCLLGVVQVHRATRA